MRGRGGLGISVPIATVFLLIVLTLFIVSMTLMMIRFSDYVRTVQAAVAEEAEKTEENFEIYLEPPEEWVAGAKFIVHIVNRGSRAIVTRVAFLTYVDPATDITRSLVNLTTLTIPVGGSSSYIFTIPDATNYPPPSVDGGYYVVKVVSSQGTERSTIFKVLRVNASASIAPPYVEYVGEYSVWWYYITIGYELVTPTCEVKIFIHNNSTIPLYKIKVNGTLETTGTEALTPPVILSTKSIDYLAPGASVCVTWFIDYRTYGVPTWVWGAVGPPDYGSFVLRYRVYIYNSIIAEGTYEIPYVIVEWPLS